MPAYYIRVEVEILVKIKYYILVETYMYFLHPIYSDMLTIYTYRHWKVKLFELVKHYE